MLKRSGLTLLELVVVLALIGFIASVVVPKVRPAVVGAPIGTVDSLRKSAAQGRRPVTAVVQKPTGPAWVTAWPSGLVVGDSAPTRLDSDNEWRYAP